MAATLPFPTPAYPRMEAPKHREKKMKALALGMSRTGTMSLYTALNELGYTCYHMTECCLNYRSDSLTDWNRAIDAKFYGKGRRFTGPDFDKMLWRYDAVADFPCSLFIEELMDAYPDAQIILTTRDLDSWIPSMERSFYRILSMERLKWLEIFDSAYLRPVMHLLRATLFIWSDGVPSDLDHLAAGSVAHNAYVRGVAQLRGRKVLEYSVTQGWGPLCRFLDKEVPDKVFPSINGGDFIAQYHYLVFWQRVVELGVPVLMAVLGYYILLWGLRWWLLPQ